MTNENLEVIQEKIGYTFNNTDLLVQAFTRKSFSAENQNWEDNEKLEFVGDRVLDFVVLKTFTSKFGYISDVISQSLSSIESCERPSADNLVEHTNYEFAYTEGEMSDLKKQIVQTASLARAIENAGLEKYLLMGKGDVKNNVQNEPHVKEDLFEAIIGAVAIDSGWNMCTVESVIDTLLSICRCIDNIENSMDDSVDYISYAQKWYQSEYGNEPEYVFYDTEGEENFQCYLDVPGINSFEGFGSSKKAAIRLAAKRLYNFLATKEKEGNVIAETVGNFDMDTAIGKLQELQDKKIISGLDFLYREEAPTAQTNGNPMWYCQCVVDGVENFVEYGDVKKIKAKKAAAYTMLEILTTGRDKILEKII